MLFIIICCSSLKVIEVDHTACISKNCTVYCVIRRTLAWKSPLIRLLLGLLCIVRNPCFIHGSETVQKLVLVEVDQHQTLLERCFTMVFCVPLWANDTQLIPKWLMICLWLLWFRPIPYFDRPTQNRGIFQMFRAQRQRHSANQFYTIEIDHAECPEFLLIVSFVWGMFFSARFIAHFTFAKIHAVVCCQ